jgi:hypothetical protein
MNKARSLFLILFLLAYGCTFDKLPFEEIEIEEIEEAPYFWDPPNICSGAVKIEIVWSPCPLPTGASVYLNTPDRPIYGEQESDVADYFESNLEICGLNEIDSGLVSAQILVYEDGTTCVRSIKSEHVFRDSKGNLKELIQDMPRWTPGRVGGEPANVMSGIRLEILDGEVVEIRGAGY